MSYLNSLPENGKLLDVFKKFPVESKPLIDYHEKLLRGPSPFSEKDREFMAAYVSTLNSCDYCAGIHKTVAEKFGVEETLLAAAVKDLEASAVEEKLKPVLRYIQKLNDTPAKMTAGDAQEVFDAGWNETALHHAVSICGLFNLMNRLVSGLGVEHDQNYSTVSANRLYKGGYAGILDLLNNH